MSDGIEVYWTGSTVLRKRLRRACLDVLNQYACTILGPRAIQRVRRIIIWFLPRRMWWDNGYRELWSPKDGTIYIRVPEPFLTKKRAAWLVFHELGHARQVIERRINVRSDDFTDVRYASPHRRKRTYIWDDDREAYRCKESGRLVESPPWEEEAWRWQQRLDYARDLVI